MKRTYNPKTVRKSNVKRTYNAPLKIEKPKEVIKEVEKEAEKPKKKKKD